MRRREFIKVLAGSAAAWPLAVRAQQREQMRRVTVLLGGLEFYDASGPAEVAAFEGGLKELGWIDGRNVQIDILWATANVAGIRKHAAELAALAPDVILAPGTGTV
ncbi:MAG: ABC transporter substrate-binding protein, partial [Pseudolabrys sp.]